MKNKIKTILKNHAFDLMQARLFEIMSSDIIHDDICQDYDYDQEAMLIASNIHFKGFNLNILKHLIANRVDIEEQAYRDARQSLKEYDRYLEYGDK